MDARRDDRAGPDRPGAGGAEGAAAVEGVIERLERAEAGSRLLDVDIARLACPESHAIQLLDGPRNPKDMVVELWSGGVSWHIPETGSGGNALLPHFTTSIDAAFSLVPRGWWVEVTISTEAAGGMCRIERCAANYGSSIRVTAASPALALCIAALKARAADMADRASEIRAPRRAPDHRASEALGRMAEVAGAMERTLNECVAILDRLLDGDQQRDSSSSTRSSRS